MKQVILICICFCLLFVPSLNSAVCASLSLYEASFEVMPNASKQWNDIQVELKITYGENNALRRRDMKSIAVKSLKAVEVREGGGKPLPFKVTPGKKQSTLIWDLPGGQRADQTVTIRFYLRDGITIKEGKNYFGAYWTGGGFSVPVEKAVYRFVFPPGYSYQSCSVYPKYGYTEGVQDNKKWVAVSMGPLQGESFALAFSPSFITWQGGVKPAAESALRGKTAAEIKKEKQETPEKDAALEGGSEEKEETLKEAVREAQDKEEADMELAVKEEPSISASTTEEGTSEQSRNEESVSAGGEAELVYDAARELMGQGKYSEALATFRYFTKTYSQHVRADDASYLIGECYFNLADEGMLPSYQPAVDALQLALALYPASANAPRGFFQLAHSLRLMGYFYEAVESYQLLMDKHPQAECIEDAHFWMGESLFQNDDYVKALEHFRLFIARYPNSALVRDATFRIADCFVGQKEFGKAREFYAQAWSRWPDYYNLLPETLYSMGQCSLKHDDYAKARSQFFMALNLFPTQSYNHIMLAKIGDTYRLEGKLEEALKVYSQNSRIYPDTRGALISAMRMADMGVAHPGFFNYDEYLEPLKVYSQIIEKNPATDLAEKALYRQGNLLSEQKRYEEAITSLITVLTAYPDSALSKKCALSLQDNLIKLIDSHFQNKSYYPIIELYDRYNNPYLSEVNNTKTLFELGESFRQIGLTQKALELYERARRIYPPNHPEDEIMLRMGELYLEHKAYQKAEELFKKLITRFPGSTYYKYALHSLGDTHFEQGHYDEARRVYLSALEGESRMKRDIKSLYYLGKCNEHTGETSAAIESYQRAIQTDEQLGPDQTDGECVLRSFLTLADCFYRVQRYRNAIEVYTRAVKRFPQDDRSQWALYRIAASYQKAGVESTDIESLKQLKASAPGETFWGKVIGGKISTLEWEVTNRENIAPVKRDGESG